MFGNTNEIFLLGILLDQFEGICNMKVFWPICCKYVQFSRCHIMHHDVARIIVSIDKFCCKS